MDSNVVTEKQVINMLDFAANMTGITLSDNDKSYLSSKLKGRMKGVEVLNALDDMIEKGVKPTLSNILSYERGGYDAPEIAYAKAIASMTDETNTCLMNDCIAQAWSVAQPLYAENMKFEANRAFIATYNEMVLKQKQTMPKPRWWLSLGSDKQKREDFIREAVQDGLISIESAKSTLPYLTDEEIAKPGLVDTSPKKTLLELKNSAESKELAHEEKELAKKALDGIKKILKTY